MRCRRARLRPAQEESAIAVLTSGSLRLLRELVDPGAGAGSGGGGGAGTSARGAADRSGTDGSSGASLRDLVRAATDSDGDAPAPVPVDRAALETVLSRLSDAVTAPLPPDWARALRNQITGSRRKVADRIDAALAASEIEARPPSRRLLVQTGHVALLALTALWVVLCFVPGFPEVLAIVLAVLSLLGSLALDLVARRKARETAVAAGQVAVGQLSVELAAVAQDELFGPIGEELSRYRSALADFKAVRDG